MQMACRQGITTFRRVFLPRMRTPTPPEETPHWEQNLAGQLERRDFYNSILPPGGAFAMPVVRNVFNRKWASPSVPGPADVRVVKDRCHSLATGYPRSRIHEETFPEKTVPGTGSFH